MKMPKDSADYCQIISFAFAELAKSKRAAKRRTAENKTLRQKVRSYEGHVMAPAKPEPAGE